MTIWERYGPFFGLASGILLGIFFLLPDEKLFLSSIATIGALLSSLTGVSVSAFISLDTGLSRTLRIKGYYKTLMEYARCSIQLSLLTTLIAVVGFFVSIEYRDNIYAPILLGTSLAAVVAFYRVFSLLLEIGGFSHPSE